MWVHSHSLYCNSIKKSMTNIILPLTILCNYGNGKYKLPMYCLYIVLHAGIIGLIIFLKPGLEPRLWAFSYGKPSPSPIQARQWAGLGWAWVGFGLWARPSTSLLPKDHHLRLHHLLRLPQLEGLLFYFFFNKFRLIY